MPYALFQLVLGECGKGLLYHASSFAMRELMSGARAVAGPRDQKVRVTWALITSLTESGLRSL